MKKVAVASVLLSAVLAACGPNAPTPVPTTLDLTGSTSVAVGQASKLSAVVKDASGSPMTANVTFTSSQPGVVAVDSSGNLTVKRLTPAGQPVTITATTGTLSRTLQVTTYGLELALGTNNYGSRAATTQPGAFMVARYRPQSGTTVAGTLTVKSPVAGNDLTCAVSAGKTERVCWFEKSNLTTYPNGEYTATITQGSTTFTTKATLSSRSSVLDRPTNVQVTNSGKVVTWNATAPASAKLFWGWVFNDTTEELDIYVDNSLPITGTVNVPTGTYTTTVEVMDFDIYDMGVVLPDTVNYAYQFGPDIDIP